MGATVSETITSDGATLGHDVGANTEVVGGVFVHGSGSFGGGTVTAQFLRPDGLWESFADSSFTADFSKQIICPNGFHVRLTMSGSTSPSVYAQISSMGYAR